MKHNGDDRMRISFIVVALNAGESLRALLDDLRAQTLPPEQLEVLRQWTLSHLEEGGPWSSHTAF